MSKFIFSSNYDVEAAICKAVGIDEEEMKYVRRIVIDLEAGEAGRVYIEKFADDQQLIAGLVQSGIRVEQATAAPGELR